MSNQYKNLISKEEYLEYIKSFTDMQSMLELHRWLAIRYAVYMPFKKSELDWYFLFLIGDVKKYQAMLMMEALRNFPKILFGTVEDKVYK